MWNVNIWIMLENILRKKLISQNIYKYTLEKIWINVKKEYSSKFYKYS